MVARYGSFVQLDPPHAPGHPGALVRARWPCCWWAGSARSVYMRGRSPARAAALSAEEEAELAEMLKSRLDEVALNALDDPDPDDGPGGRGPGHPARAPPRRRPASSAPTPSPC